VANTMPAVRWLPAAGIRFLRRYVATTLVALHCSLAAGAQDRPRVRILTDLGAITVVLEPTKAPRTVANFLRYVDDHRYDGSAFYRAVTPRNQLPALQQPPIEAIQGGLAEDDTKRLPPIVHESTARTGLRHADGVISMARIDIGSASSDFFIVIGEQPSLDHGGRRHPDGQGFAAFGRVVTGMDVVRRIQQMPAEGGPPQRLLRPVRIQRISRVP
jgi:peptidyl-prolyl cis-trans isomerase A (cyclophilin A)